MVQFFLLFDTITNEKTKFMHRDKITSTSTWHLGLVGSNNFGEYSSFSPFTLMHSTVTVFTKQMSLVNRNCDMVTPTRLHFEGTNGARHLVARIIGKVLR